MNYTRQQREDLHKAFKAAESYLGKQWFLCMAVVAAHRAGKITESQKTLAKRLINYRIHPHRTVGTWLNSSAGVPPHELTDKTKLAYRKRWLESLIKEFSK